jgi:hypothetical protein
MFTHPTKTALSSQATTPQSPNNEAIPDTRSRGDDITAPPGEDAPSNNVVVTLGEREVGCDIRPERSLCGERETARER